MEITIVMYTWVHYPSWLPAISHLTLQGAYTTLGFFKTGVEFKLFFFMSFMVAVDCLMTILSTIKMRTPSLHVIRYL